MNNSNDISEELKGMGSPLAHMLRKMPYQTPSDYFITLESHLLQTITSLSEPDVQPLFGKLPLPYSVPVNYFKDLVTDIATKVSLHSATSAIPDTIPFNVPAGYFEALPAQLLAAAKAGKQIELKPAKQITFRPVKWAAAAIILISIATGSYITFFSKGNVLSPDKILASVPNNEIHDYLQGTYVLDIDRVVSNTDINKIDLDNKDIIQYLNETGWDATE